MPVHAGGAHHYCFMPCTVVIAGVLHTERVRLTDPEMQFEAYILSLRQPISVPESGQFQALSDQSQIQLEFLTHRARGFNGQCVEVTGELTAAITASDIRQLVMQVHSIHVCRT